MKSKWENIKDRLTEISAWARDGLTDKQIAHNLGISESTLNKYKLDHPEFSESLKKDKEVVDIEVENALLKRAKGYEFTEERVEVETNKSGEVVGRKVTQTIKQVIPDTTAQIFWLKNRRPDKWRDQQNVEHSGIVNVNNPFSGLTTDELKKLIGND